MFLTSNLVPTGSGARATTSIVNSTSAGGAFVNALSFSSSTKTTSSGAMTANTLKTMINISGSAGAMSVLGVSTNDATARTVRIKVTIDGAVVYDATTSSVSSANQGHILAGAYTGSSNTHDDGNPIRWRTSCLVEIASNLTETDKLTFGYKYMLES